MIFVNVSFLFLQCPTFKREADGTESPEPFAAEAKFFTESRLLQRDVQIILESCPNQIILGTILHPVRHTSRHPCGGTDIKITVSLIVLMFVPVSPCFRMATLQNSC